jgi:hypothetical protein
MIYNYISVFHVIEKIYRDYPHKQELDVWDVVEWAAEALDFVASYEQLEKVPNKVITIANYKAKLPCELVTLDGVKYNDMPLVYASSVYGPTNRTDVTPPDNTINHVDVDSENFPMLGTGTINGGIPSTYVVQDGYIHTNVQSGEVVISYTAVKVDKDGYPMIPDDVAFKAAITNYVQMMLDRREWRSQRAPEAHYRDSQREWTRLVRNARGRAQMPSLDKMETIKRMWTRLRTNPNSHNSGFGSFIAPNSKN